MTATGLLLGSPAYISPEVASGKVAGSQSDAWGLGALLFAAVTSLGDRPGKNRRWAAIAVLAALLLQLTIGIGMVKQGFPLWLATAHNAGAALLLLSTLALNRALRRA